MIKLYRVETYIRIKYFKTLGGAERYAKRFDSIVKEVISPEEIEWAIKQLNIKEVI